MGFLSRFEGKMEDAFEGAADRMGNAPISPVQIAKRAEKQMRREKMVGAGKQYAPTLYTILVNPDDDQRLFGYYPTLAGETETYLAAKAADEGLVMDGQPLVRFIVDEELKHGKFDVIAEPVAAPIIAQLRAEEMQRYGLGGSAAPVNYAAPVTPVGYAAPAPTPAPVYPQPQAQPYQNAQAGFNNYQASPVGYDNANAPAPAYDNYPAAAGYDEFGAPVNDYTNYDAADGTYDDYNELDPNAKPPLPYVPEDELDYSIDYGEYTFNSQDFDDYSQNGRVQGEPIAPAAPEPLPVAAAAPIAAAPVVASAAAAPVAANTVVFTNDAAQVNAVPSQTAVRASLIDTTNNRAYSLASTRLLMGRESKNDIVVDDINASRTHAELRLEPQGVWTITDLGSTNGTLVNGIEIATHPLREGDHITIGMTNYVFTQAQ